MKKFKLSVAINILLTLIVIILGILFLKQRALITELKGESQGNLKLEQELSELKDESQKLNKEILRLEEENNNKKIEIKKLNDEIQNMEIIDAASIQYFKNIGINDYELIIEDLKAHPELIPFDGVLGGNMFFTKVYLLNDHWVYAIFEDGHIQGYGLYEFSIDENLDILWKVINAILDE